MYSLIVDRLERHVIAERHVAAVMKAGGAKRVEVPTFEREKTRLDRLLGDRRRRRYSGEQAELIAALGLGE